MCPRYVILSYYYKTPLVTQKEFPPKTYLTFRLGDKIEDIVRETLGGKKPPPMALKIDDLYIVGSPDILLEDKYLIECKSIKLEGFNKLNEPYVKHVAQLSFYLWLAEKHSLNYSKTGAIIYVPKEESEDIVKVFPVTLKPVFRNIFENIVEQIRKGIKERKLPKRICENTNLYMARKCKLVRQCFKRR